MPEELPVQQQVDDEQGGEYKTRDIVIQDPVVPGNPHSGNPTASPPSAGRKVEIEHKSGDKRWDERDQAADIDQCIDGDALHDEKILPSDLARFHKAADLVANLFRFLQRFLIGKHVALMVTVPLDRPQ